MIYIGNNLDIFEHYLVLLEGNLAKASGYQQVIDIINDNKIDKKVSIFFVEKSAIINDMAISKNIKKEFPYASVFVISNTKRDLSKKTYQELGVNDVITSDISKKEFKYRILFIDYFASTIGTE